MGSALKNISAKVNIDSSCCNDTESESNRTISKKKIIRKIRTDTPRPNKKIRDESFGKGHILESSFYEKISSNSN